jgi:hypothetical protein
MGGLEGNAHGSETNVKAAYGAAIFIGAQHPRKWGSVEKVQIVQLLRSVQIVSDTSSPPMTTCRLLAWWRMFANGSAVPSVRAGLKPEGELPCSGKFDDTKMREMMQS